MTNDTLDFPIAGLRTLAALLVGCSLALLAVACGSESDARGTETRCEDRKDGDRDGLFDCNDPDCADRPVCVREHCYNLIDDDGDGLVDCDDDQCDGRSVCSGSAEDCVNGVDDDGDGDADCADSGCEQTATCLPDGEDCTNGRDDDGDGDVDCDDDACKGTAVCARKLERCDDGEDNDGDGAADCDDDDCARTAACLDGGEDCSNGLDDDGDGRTDCQDTDCAYSGTCLDLAEDCDNSLDDDGDGAVDCDDSSCSDSSACSLGCQRDLDNDGTPDCEDADADGDGVDDARDPCPRVVSADNNCTDTDGDLIGDSLDNCPSTPNTDQRDRDSNGEGNACDPVESLDDADITITPRSGFSRSPSLVGAADFDDDDRVDLLFTQNREDVYWLLSDVLAQRGGTLDLDSPDVDVALSYSLEQTVVGDINDDGVPDLVQESRGSNTIELSILLGPFTESDAFDRAQSVRSIEIPFDDQSFLVAIALEDINADGRDDVIVGVPYHAQNDGAVFGFDAGIIDQGQGPILTLDDASWSVAGSVPSGGFGFDIQPTDDFDGDGLDDLAVMGDVVGSPADRLVILSAQGMLAAEPSNTAKLSVVYGDNVNYRASIIPDIDGNGFDDVFIRATTCGTDATGQALVRLTQPLLSTYYETNAEVFLCNEALPYRFDAPPRFIDIDFDDVSEFFLPTQAKSDGSVALYFFESWHAARNAPDTPKRRIEAADSSGYLEVHEVGDLDQNGHRDLLLRDRSGSQTPSPVRIWLWP